MSRSAHRVRFTHLGVLYEGQIRPACRPDKPNMAMTGNIKKVTCHACTLALEDFYKMMEAKKEAGEMPDDFEGVGVRKKEHRALTGDVKPTKAHPNRRMVRAVSAARRKK